MKKVALSPVCVLSTFAKNQLTLRYGDAITLERRRQEEVKASLSYTVSSRSA